MNWLSVWRKGEWAINSKKEANWLSISRKYQLTSSNYSPNLSLFFLSKNIFNIYSFSFSLFVERQRLVKWLRKVDRLLQNVRCLLYRCEWTLCCAQRSMVHIVQYTVDIIHCIIYTIVWALLNSSQCTVFIVRCKLFFCTVVSSAHFPLFSTHQLVGIYTMYFVHCTAYIVKY